MSSVKWQTKCVQIHDCISSLLFCMEVWVVQDKGEVRKGKGNLAVRQV